MNGALLNSDINSCSYIICDGILQRLKAVPTFQSVRRWSTTPMLRVQSQIEANQLPYVGLYLMEESMLPDGDANHGEPRFHHSVKIGFQVIITSPDDAAAKANLDSAHWTILRLLEYERWHTFPSTGDFMINPWTGIREPVRIEAVTRGSRKERYGNRMINNEAPLAELEMDLTLTHRTYFPPIIPDSLGKVHVTVAYPWPYNPELEEPFTVEYDLPMIGDFTVADYSLLGPDFESPFLGTLRVSDYSLASPAPDIPPVTTSP
jgi:hypothetical protein